MSKAVNVEVTARQSGGDTNKMIRKFIKKVKKERVLERYREKSFYEKPSDRRRRERLRKKENARKAESQRNKNIDTTYNNSSKK